MLFLSLPPALSVPCRLHTPGEAASAAPPALAPGVGGSHRPAGGHNHRLSFPSRHQRCHHSAPPAQLLSPCSSLTYIPAWTQAPLTFSLLLFQLSTNKILLQAGGCLSAAPVGSAAARGGSALPEVPAGHPKPTTALAVCRPAASPVVHPSPVPKIGPCTLSRLGEPKVGGKRASGGTLEGAWC